ncbi:MAG: glycosyltransferase family 2 protein [Streptococcaceae bacterium]|jgi:glycosyltransferase involved in cell wall biosynthesis|nr:glycosyltransferase family 2 protein [Streptococcaceae bacterium]
MKTISIVIPTYNEEENVTLLHDEIKKYFMANLEDYSYEMIFIDNDSQDSTREKLLKICEKDSLTKAIFNAKNFGQFNSPYYGLLQASGDAVILMCADFQDPIEMIGDFVREWENGYKIVIGVKTQSKENRIMYALRGVFYKTMKKFSNVDQIEHFTGFGLYDKSFINVLRDLKDPQPYLRGIVAELGFDRKELPYTQAARLHGKTSNNFFRLFDVGMVGITSYTKGILRLATFAGFSFSMLGILLALIYLVLKLVYWNQFPLGQAPLLIGMFLFSSVQIFFIGFLGEYIMAINSRVMNRPLVIEEKRINF